MEELGYTARWVVVVTTILNLWNCEASPPHYHLTWVAGQMDLGGRGASIIVIIGAR